MISSGASFPRFSVTLEREEMEVRTHADIGGPTQKVPDPAWKFVDKKGHGHFWDGDKLPTLQKIVTGKTWIGDEYDGYEEDVWHWACVDCGANVKPKYTRVPVPPILGPLWVFVKFDRPLDHFVLNENDGRYRLTPDQYAASVASWEEKIREITGRL